MTAVDFQRDLNPQQLAAATAPDGPVFVLAAAGTGKTRTLVYRVAYLLSRAIPPQRILLLTFTNRAAREMLERAEKLAGQNVGGLWGGTFHHMANRILRRHAEAIGYSPDFVILDADDSRALLRECIADLKLKGRSFPKPEVLQSVFSTALNRRIDPQDAIFERFSDTPIAPADILRVYQCYVQKKQKQQLMDFDDLLVNAVRLLETAPDVLNYYQQHFLYVMVDEYQDTNALQAALVDALAARHRNLLVVGDDFQSIYAWRGADYRNIMSFPERYADARVFKLEINYRSVPEILAVANQSIAHNPRQFQKTLQAVRPPAHKPIVAQLQNGEHQARYVMEQLQKRHAGGCAWHEMAVLYRAHYQSMELQMALARAHIPYIVTSGVRFFEQAHIKDACAFLRMLTNSRDFLAFKRLMRLLPGIGDKTVEKLWQRMEEHFPTENPAANTRLLTLLPTAAQATWRALLSIINAYHTTELAEDAGEIVRLFVKHFYRTYVQNTYDDFRRRLEDLEEMVLFTTNFESVAAFLNEVALLTNVEAETDRLAAQSGDYLRLSTIHQAKGLEWRFVVVLWLTEGMFPAARAIENGEGDEEERRLFYVAVTRAKDELILCVPETHRNYNGSTDYLMPSRFIREIPPHLLTTKRISSFELD